MNSQTQPSPVIEMTRDRDSQLKRRGNSLTGAQGRGHIAKRGGEHAELELTQCKSKTRKPRMFKVILLNDDYTPMEFVIRVLQRFFHFNHEEATRLMLEIHNQGKGMCGTFSREIAETKVASVNSYSRLQKHPLLCMMEPNADAK